MPRNATVFAKHKFGVKACVTHSLALQLLLRKGLQDDGQQQVHEAVGAEKRGTYVKRDYIIHRRDAAHLTVLVIL